MSKNSTELDMSSPSTNHRLFILPLSIVLVATLGLGSLYFNSFMQPATADSNYLSLQAAEVLPLDIDLTELDDYASQWQPIRFPVHWRDKIENTRAVWYRLNVSEDTLEGLSNADSAAKMPLLGIYIWRVNQTADIWLNGEKIGSGGRTIETMARHWNSPLYFAIPSSLIEPSNEILIKHYAEHSWGSMQPLVLGSENFLKPIFETRYFIQHDIALALFVFVLVTGIFSFTVWFNRRQSLEYFWFGVSSIGLSFYCLNQFIRYLPIDAAVWRWIANISTDLWAASIFICMCRSLNLRKPKIEKLALSYVLIGIPVYFYASFFEAFIINIYFHIGALCIAICSFYVSAVEYWRTRNQLPLFYCFIIALIFIAGVHDTVMQAILNAGIGGNSESSFQFQFNMVHFAAPLTFLSIGASLIKSFIDSMNAVDRLNSELEARISDARLELKENYEAIEAVLIKQSASEERERIYRDLHDDVGSKLLSLYYRLDNKSDSTLAKSALEDLRDIVSRKSMESSSLTDAIQQWQSEAFNRTSDANIELTWELNCTDESSELDESQNAQLRRMLREVLSNAILHGESVSKISVTIEANQKHLIIKVQNDGVTVPANQWKPGRGLSNLRVRSRDLQGELELNDIADGVVEVAWKIPLLENAETT